MDAEVKEYIDGIIALAQATSEQVEYFLDTTPQRVILRLEGRYRGLRVLITELFSDRIRKYRYYVLRGDWVEAGFDNSPDPRAIRLKYGKIRTQHAGENVSHLHLENKTQPTLTPEMTFAAFVKWLKTRMQSTSKNG